MNTVLLRIEIRSEPDVVRTRQRARLIAEQLGFERQDQTRIATAVSEIARNAQQYGGGGEVEFSTGDTASLPQLTITVRDHGPGIAQLDAVLAGHYISRTGMGRGIVGSRRLLDFFHVATTLGQGTTVTFGKLLPATAPPLTPEVVRRITEALALLRTDSPLEESRAQNQELLGALELLRQREEDVTRINRELSATNTGLIALYSELDDHAQRLQTAESLLQARNAELKGFAYTVSHDLKAPLRGISGYAQELERKHQTGLSERAVFCVTQILTATRNLDHLIEDLLQFARLEAEFPVRTAVNPRHVIAAILQDRSLIVAELHAEVTMEIPDASLHTWDRGFVQVMANLIDNALKYSRHATPPRLGLCAVETDTSWQFIVRDNGIGFEMQYHDRIFGLFNRLVRTEEFEGTGAGLAIARKILDKLGGTIRAEAQPGQGATFFVELPKSPVPTETRLSPAL